MKKIVSVIICTLVLMSGFVINTSALEETEEKIPALAYVPSGYELMNFGELYADKKLEITQNESKATVSQKEENLIITGKPSEISKLGFEFADEVDFGDYTAGRLVLNAIREVKYASSVNICFDNDSSKTVSVDAVKQTRSGKWVGEKNRCADISSYNLSGKHKLSFGITFGDNVADKKTEIMLKNMLFVAYSVPVVDIGIDESLGTIDAMNADREHQTECYGEMSINIPEGYKPEYTDEKLKSATYELDYIRGRGNSTWDQAKKPYKIKLKKKASLLGMGANKHWGLIANYFDYTLLRNKYTYWLGAKMDMEFTPKCAFVDLVMNGSYLGSYALSELVRVDENRVDIDNLEDTPEVVSGDELTGGYLLNMQVDFSAAKIETEKGNTFTVETPDFTENYVDAQYNYIKAYLNKAEEAIYSENLCDSDGNPYTDYIDVDAMIDYFIVQGTSANADSFINGSTYLYKKRGGKLKWGPLWDFDYVAWWATNFDMDDVYESYALDDAPWIKELFRKDASFKEKYIARMKEFDEVIRQSAQDSAQIDVYAKEVYLSQYANHSLIPSVVDEHYDEEGNAASISYDKEIARFKSDLLKRAEWQDNNTALLVPEDDGRSYVFEVDGEYLATLNRAQLGNYDYMQIEIPEKPGYVFDEWCTQVEGVGEVGIYEYLSNYIENETSDTVFFYAKWYGTETISVLNKSALTLNAGKTFTLKSTVSVKPSKWLSGNTKVVTVKDGKVTALKKGTATVYAVFENNIYHSCKVTVKTDPALRIKGKPFSAKKTYSVKKGKYLTVKITGKASAVKNVYSTTNKKIAKVTSKKTASTVKIKALKKGNATVTLKVNGVSYMIKVKVKKTGGI